MVRCGMIVEVRSSKIVIVRVSIIRPSISIES